MDDKVKELIIHVVQNGTLKNVQDTLENHKLVRDDSFFDYEILKVALKRKDEEVAKYLLLKKSCRVRHRNKNNLKEETPLHLAALYKKIGCIQTILEGGASIYDRNHLGRLPIYEAFRQGYMNVCKEILQYCLNLRNLNPKNQDDVLHFHIACVLNVVNLVKVYLEFEFDVNSTLILDVGDNYVFERGIFQGIILIYPGMTPLHYASGSGFVEMVQLLLEYGADIDKTDAEGRTALPMSISRYILHVSNFSFYEKEREQSRKVTEILLEKKPRLYLADISFLSNWQNSLEDTYFVEYAQLYQAIYVNIQKLLALKLHVCENVQEYCDKLKPFHKRATSMTNQLIDLDRIKDDCRKELEKMNLTIIDDDGTSLHSVLFKDSQELSKYIKNSVFYNIVNDEKIEASFPFYGYLLKMQYKKGVKHPLKYAKSSLDQSLCSSCSSGVKLLSKEDVTNSNGSEDDCTKELDDMKATKMDDNALCTI